MHTRFCPARGTNFWFRQSTEERTNLFGHLSGCHSECARGRSVGSYRRQPSHPFLTYPMSNVPMGDCCRVHFAYNE